MSNKTDEIVLSRNPGLAPHLIGHARANWTQGNLMRQILEIELESAIETHRTTLETCDPDQLKTLQGKISGIRQTLGTIKTQEK